MKTVVKTTAKKPVKTAVKAASKVAPSTGSALRGAAMTSQELHESMLAYGKKVTATKASARAFLKRIGAPV